MTTAKDHNLNITLPEETIKLIDQLTPKGNHSQFINEAVQYYITQKAFFHFQEQLKEGAICRAKRDLELAEEWFDLEEEACQKNKE